MMKKEFSKSYTRDFSIIMEEAWYHALSKGLWDLLDVAPPSSWPNIFYFNKGIIEVWDNKSFIQEIFAGIRTKNNNKEFFNNLIKKYKVLVEFLKDDTTNDSDYVEKLFETISIFSIVWYGHLDPNTEESLLKEFVNVRDTDTIFDSNDKLVRMRILRKFPELKGFETSLLKKEFLTQIPETSILKERLQNFVLVPDVYSKIITLDAFALENNIILERFIVEKEGFLKGVIANSGIAKGKVRIIRMKSDVHKMEEGEVIVSPMTTPDVFPAMDKACAIVTDEGGMLCHAAIISRELNKPCIIGTKVASEVFKDGDLVKVDANAGVVRRIEK